MIINVDTVRGIIMETTAQNFDEIISQYMTVRYRAYFYMPGYQAILTNWYYGKDGLNALQTLCNIVRKSSAVKDTVAYIQSQHVVMAKAVRIAGDIEKNEE